MKLFATTPATSSEVVGIPLPITRLIIVVGLAFAIFAGTAMPVEDVLPERVVDVGLSVVPEAVEDAFSIEAAGAWWRPSWWNNYWVRVARCAAGIASLFYWPIGFGRAYEVARKGGRAISWFLKGQAKAGRLAMLVIPGACRGL